MTWKTVWILRVRGEDIILGVFDNLKAAEVGKESALRNEPRLLPSELFISTHGVET